LEGQGLSPVARRGATNRLERKEASTRANGLASNREYRWSRRKMHTQNRRKSLKRPTRQRGGSIAPKKASARRLGRETVERVQEGRGALARWKVKRGHQHIHERGGCPRPGDEKKIKKTMGEEYPTTVRPLWGHKRRRFRPASGGKKGTTELSMVKEEGGGS